MPASEDEGCLSSVYTCYTGLGCLHSEMEHLIFLITLGKNDGVTWEAFGVL